MQPDGVVAREHELETVATMLGRVAEGPVAVVLDGEAGIGKTTVWRRAVADAPGFTVLAASPSEAERDLSFAALADLLEPAVGLLDLLPAPQRRALRAALLLDEPEGLPPDGRAIGAGVVASLRALAAERPVLLAVDDVQWLDEPTRSALAFAVRRLEDAPVALVLARRTEGSPAELPFDLDRTVPESRVVRLRLAPLSVGGIGRMVRLALGSALRRPTLHRVHAASGGNPLYALQLAREVLEHGEPAAGGDLPLPPTHADLVARRLATVSKEATEALAAAAALADPTFERMQAAAADPEAALATGLVELRSGRIRFLHPVFSAAVLSTLSPARRRDLHRRLAGVVETLEERARHLAAAVDEPDEEIAAVLDDAARSARNRGAPHVAVDLAERAARLTPVEGEALWRRLRFAGETAVVAGDYERGRTSFDELLERMPSGPARAEATLALILQPRDMREAIALAGRAAEDAGADAALRSDALARRAIFRYATAEIEGALADCDVAAEAARSAGDVSREAIAVGQRAFVEAATGGAADFDALRAAAAAEELLGPPRPSGSTEQLAIVLSWRDHLEEAREVAERLLLLARERGDVSQAEIGVTIANVEWRLGRREEAERSLDEALELAEQLGLGQMIGAVVAGRAFLRAVSGRYEECEADLARAGALAREASDVNAEQRCLFARLMLELTRRDWPAAREVAGEALEVQARTGKADFDVLLVHDKAAEAALAVGAVDEAAALADALAEAALVSPTPRRAVIAARTAALVAAARDDLPGAVSEVERALELLPEFRSQHEVGRTLLAAGSVLRRARQRARARQLLERAVAAFEGCGSSPWADLAREELARLSGRTPAGDVLTPAEGRVAELAAAGRSTKEIAAALFVSPKTVEGHVTRIYEKLGVRSRAELAVKLRGNPS